MYSKKELMIVTKNILDIIKDNENYLAEIDGKSGDGDLGPSMLAAFEAINESFASNDSNDLGNLLMKAAMACNKAAPSTMGTLVSSGIMASAKEFKGKEEIVDVDVVKIPKIFATAIMERGKAQLGDKTILDALIPFADEFEKAYATNNDLKKSFVSACQAAKDGAQATKGMLPKMGRARWIAQRAQDNMDAGAAMLAIIVNGLQENI